MEQQNLADRIQQLRREHGLSQEQLAEKLNVSLPGGIQVGIRPGTAGAGQDPCVKRAVLRHHRLPAQRQPGHAAGSQVRPGVPADAVFASRVLYLAALFFLGVGLVCALAAWHEKQTADCIAGGMVVQGIGVVCYGVGRMLSPARPARWMVKAGCAVGLFLPLVVLAWQLDPLIRCRITVS